jgi:hypothetical protein
MRNQNTWPYRVSNSDLSVIELVGNLYTDCATASHTTTFLTLLKTVVNGVPIKLNAREYYPIPGGNKYKNLALLVGGV